MSELATVRNILRNTLQLGQRAEQFGMDTPLLGHVAELDSMAVVAVLTAIEEHYGIAVDDGDLSADVFATVGTLAAFVESKLS
ncbi:MAG: acyl carrier protein, partial [Gammaproteobacteria bacterium]|nr:acyl carrier protein [Gammaproteobacteria bacterium]